MYFPSVLPLSIRSRGSQEWSSSTQKSLGLHGLKTEHKLWSCRSRTSLIRMEHSQSLVYLLQLSPSLPDRLSGEYEASNQIFASQKSFEIVLYCIIIKLS